MSYPISLNLTDYGEFPEIETKATITLTGESFFCAIFSSRSSVLAKALDMDLPLNELAQQLNQYLGERSETWTVRDLHLERQLLSGGSSLASADLGPFVFKLQAANRFPFHDLTQSLHETIFRENHRLILPRNLEIVGANALIGKNGLVSFAFLGVMDKGWSTDLMTSVFGSSELRLALSRALAEEASAMLIEGIDHIAGFTKWYRERSVTGKMSRTRTHADPLVFQSAYFVLGGELEQEADPTLALSPSITEMMPRGKRGNVERIVTSHDFAHIGPSLSVVGTRLDVAERVYKFSLVARITHALLSRYSEACAQADRLYLSDKDLSPSDFGKLTKAMNLSYLRVWAAQTMTCDEAVAARDLFLLQWGIEPLRERGDFLISALDKRASKRRLHEMKEFQVAVQGLLIIMLLLALVGGFADLRILGLLI